jgi:general stress protein 26
MTDENTERVWTLIEKISFCMLATWSGSEIHARPMSSIVRPAENAVFFLTDVAHHKDDEIEKCPTVTLVFSDPGAQKYVSLIGQAELSNDRENIKQLWSIPAKAWWQSPEDESIRVLKVTPQAAEYWDSPGTVVSYVKMALAAVTDTRPELGDNRKTSM